MNDPHIAIIDMSIKWHKERGNYMVVNALRTIREKFILLNREKANVHGV